VRLLLECVVCHDPHPNTRYARTRVSARRGAARECPGELDVNTRPPRRTVICRVSFEFRSPARSEDSRALPRSAWRLGFADRVRALQKSADWILLNNAAANAANKEILVLSLSLFLSESYLRRRRIALVSMQQTRLSETKTNGDCGAINGALISRITFQLLLAASSNAMLRVGLHFGRAIVRTAFAAFHAIRAWKTENARGGTQSP